MKNFIIGVLQVIFGYRNYLFLFSCAKITTVRFDSRKKDFLRFVKIIPRNCNGLVIGANTGITTIPLARHISSGKIFAFEPVQQNADVLNRVLQFYKVKDKVSVFLYALGNSEGKIKMILPVWLFTKKHGFAHVVNPDLAGNEKGIVSDYPIRSLDNIEELKTLKIDFIKIVAENSEYSIFSGAKNLIRKNSPVIYCELWDNDHRLQVLNLVKSYGYQVKVFRNGKLHHYDPSIDLKKYFLFLPA